MPKCYITFSENTSDYSDSDLQFIRKTIASGLNSKTRKLDENHISLHIQHGNRSVMLGDIELDIFAQLYFRRLFSRDKRANYISEKISLHFGCGCATWINMCMVGYSRATSDGDYYSDADNKLIRFLQKARGISTRNKH